MKTLETASKAMTCMTLMLSLLGCAEALEVEAPGPLDEIDLTSQEIQGGVNSDVPAVMGMASIQGRGFGICSGTLIAPNLLMTAQHCVSSDVPDFILCGLSEFGTNINDSQIYLTPDPQISRRGTFFQTLEVVRPPGGNDVCGFDIALLILDSNVPESMARPIIPKIDIAATPGDQYTAIGYGHTGSGSGSGTRRQRENQFVTCVGETCPSSVRLTEMEFYGDEGTCQGDSGGPAIDAEGRVFGALSRGGSGCGDAIYSAVFPWSDWILEVGARAAELGGYEPPHWVQTGTSTQAVDQDLDDVLNSDDNCPDDENPEQADLDGDGVGDVCDPDLDGDGASNGVDNCPEDANADQADIDEDGLGDLCDADIDGDELDNEDDNCPELNNPDQTDLDGDGQGDVCDEDTDGDTVADVDDNCPTDTNEDQLDFDGDDVGDACDDLDGRSSVASASGDGCAVAPARPPMGPGGVALIAAVLLALRRRRRG